MEDVFGTFLIFGAELTVNDLVFCAAAWLTLFAFILNVAGDQDLAVIFLSIAFFLMIIWVVVWVVINYGFSILGVFFPWEDFSII